MNIIIKEASKETLKDKFIKEKNRLKDMIYHEIECMEKGKVNNTSCGSVEVLKDAIFVIDRCFEDITSNLNKHNLKEKEYKLNQFEQSLQYVIYGK